MSSTALENVAAPTSATGPSKVVGKTWIWWIIVIVFLVLFMVGAVFLRYHARKRSGIGLVYDRMSGDIASSVDQSNFPGMFPGIPLPVSAIRQADHAEYSIKVQRNKPPVTRRVGLQFKDRALFLEHVPDLELRTWVEQQQKTITPVSYILATDDATTKVYLDDGYRVIARTSTGETRRYTPRPHAPLPTSVAPHLASTTIDHARTLCREKKGVPIRSALLRFRKGATFRDPMFVEDICTTAHSAGNSLASVIALRRWMGKAAESHLFPAWMQIQDDEIAVYARKSEWD